MGWGKLILLALSAPIAVATVEAKVGSTRYELNGAVYAVPHKYEFIRNFRLPWLEGVKGLDKESNESVWLKIPAKELARDIRGYHRKFRGYSTDIEADVVVNVLGGKEAREFPQDRTGQLRKVADALASGKDREVDKASGWERIYSMRGAGGSIFYLIPTGGPEKLPYDWRPPSCVGSEAMRGRETYDCQYIIHRNGLTFIFTLRQENLGVANRIPDYLLARLKKWRD